MGLADLAEFRRLLEPPMRGFVDPWADVKFDWSHLSDYTFAGPKNDPSSLAVVINPPGAPKFSNNDVILVPALEMGTRLSFARSTTHEVLAVRLTRFNRYVVVYVTREECMNSWNADELLRDLIKRANEQLTLAELTNGNGSAAQANHR